MSVPETRALAGQLYMFSGLVPHTCRDGRKIELQVWKSHCADCGAPFEFKSPTRNRFMPNRRCAEHKRPGRRVRRVWEGAR